MIIVRMSTAEATPTTKIQRPSTKVLFSFHFFALIRNLACIAVWVTRRYGRKKCCCCHSAGQQERTRKKKLLYGGNSFLWLELAAEKFNAFLWFLLGFGIFVLVIIDHTL